MQKIYRCFLLAAAPHRIIVLFMLAVPDQSEELGKLHHDQRHKHQSEAKQVILPRQGHQPERDADRRKEHDCDQSRRSERPPS